MVVCTYVCLCVCARAGVNMYYISISLGVCNISIKINTSVKKEWTDMDTTMQRHTMIVT